MTRHATTRIQRQRARLRAYATVLGAVSVMASCGGAGEAAIRAAYIGADGITLEVGVDTCNADLTTDVVETGAQVEVTVMVENNTTADCADSIRITLDAPLGDRTLVDGSSGETVDVLPSDG